MRIDRGVGEHSTGMATFRTGAGFLTVTSVLLAFPQPIICGWLSDYWGDVSHRVVIVCGFTLSMTSIATLFVADIYTLGAIYLIQTAVINQCLDQILKIMAVRTNVVYGEDEDKKEYEAQRTGGMADVWTSLLEVIGFATAYFTPDPYSQPLLVGYTATLTFLMALWAARYRKADFLHPKERLDSGDVSTEMTQLIHSPPDSPDSESRQPQFKWRWCSRYACKHALSCAPSSPLHKFGVYLRKGTWFFKTSAVMIPLLHYLLLQLYNVRSRSSAWCVATHNLCLQNVVQLPLSQDEADGFPASAYTHLDTHMHP